MFFIENNKLLLDSKNIPSEILCNMYYLSSYKFSAKINISSYIFLCSSIDVFKIKNPCNPCIKSIEIRTQIRNKDYSIFLTDLTKPLYTALTAFCKILVHIENRENRENVVDFECTMLNKDRLKMAKNIFFAGEIIYYKGSVEKNVVYDILSNYEYFDKNVFSIVESYLQK